MSLPLLCLIIFLTQIAVVGIFTLRTVFLVQGRKEIAMVLGFFEALINILALSSVVKNVDQPMCAISFAVGFAFGSYLGVTVEAWLRVGDQVMRIFSRNAQALVQKLRQEGLPVTLFAGEGREGPVDMLFLKVKRRGVEKVVRLSMEIDPTCFYVVDDIRSASSQLCRTPKAAWWTKIRRPGLQTNSP